MIKWQNAHSRALKNASPLASRSLSWVGVFPVRVLIEAVKPRFGMFPVFIPDAVSITLRAAHAQGRRDFALAPMLRRISTLLQQRKLYASSRRCC